MRFLDTVSIFVLVTNFFSPVLFAQSVSEQRRETYYQNLEARARSLSQKLAEISGTEPIPFHSPKRSVLSTMETNPPNASPQTAYDSLPGPIVEPASTPAPQSETLYRADGTPVILQAAPTTSPAIASPPSSVPKKRAIRRNMEKERGAYFIQPFVGVAVPPSTQTFKGLVVMLPLRLKLEMLWDLASVGDGIIWRARFILAT